jgi:hypothetical protein
MARFHPSKRAKRILFSLGALAVGNFVVYECTSQRLGGDATRGYIGNGRYYLCSRIHCTEVAESVWRYVYWHELAAYAGIALLLLVVAVLTLSGAFESESPGDTAPRREREWRD